MESTNRQSDVCSERKAEGSWGKGGHIVESAPGFLSVHADKSLFVLVHTYPSHPLVPLFSKHVPA